MYTIKILENAEEMVPHYELTMQLNYKIDRDTYRLYLEEMTSQGYKQLAIYEGENCVGIAGYWVATKFYSGKYLELDNVIVDKNARSKGIGKLICDRLEVEAKKIGCKTAVLNAYVQNNMAHKFYMKEGYRILGFHFIKPLDN